ncbi:MAG: tRNA (adenosine(37)-N6)-threonylcarbamoyltransferase complex ATPase subunit type 1 TsaE [Candidatus Paceibacterota bacterium]
MKKNEITTISVEETWSVAGEFIAGLLSRPKKSKATLICLWGDLGSGKTAFTQGLGRELGVKENLNSPTFLIMKKYVSLGEYKNLSLFHFDTYRISDKEDILNLGWAEILEDENNIVVVEWPEKIAEILPSVRIDVHFVVLSENSRRIIFDA